MTNFPKSVLTCAIALAMLHAADVRAQDDPAPPEHKPVTLDGVLVTATKRAESPAKIPTAISVLEGEQLRTLGVSNVGDLPQVTPGVTVGRFGNGVNIAIRGVTTTDLTSKGEPGVAFNVDGIYVARPQIQALAFFDIDHVEVLRGPQGTLYGKSATGGAVNVLTKMPEIGETDGHVRLETGNHDTRRAEFGFNLPINDTMALRVAGASNDQDGWLQPSDGSVADGYYVTAKDQAARSDTKNRTARLTYLWQPSDALKAEISATGGHVGGIGAGQAVVDHLQQGGSATLKILPNPFKASVDEDFLNFNSNVSYDFGATTLTWVGAHHHFEGDDFSSSNNNPDGNYQGPPIGYQPLYSWGESWSRVNVDSHELRLSNSEQARVDYVVGLNYYREDIHESDHYWSAPVTDATYAGSSNGTNALNETVHTSYGVFGQSTWHLTDQWGLVTGLRYSSDEVRRVGTFAAGPLPWPNASGGICTAPEDCIGDRANGYQKANKLTWRVGLNYQMDPANLLYASVATGYKAGGFNDYDPATLGAGTYEPEELVAYEAGYKGLLWDRVRLNSALYYYDYSRMQVTGLIAIGSSMVVFTRSTPVRMYGWENDATIALSANTELAFAATWQHTEFKDFMAGAGQDVDWTGQSVDSAPRFVGSMTLNHGFMLGNGDELRLRLYSRYSSQYLASDFGTPVRLTQGAYTRSDASLTWQPAGRPWSLQAFVNNIENDVQMIGTVGTYSASIVNAATVAVTPPRMYGLRFNLDF